MDTLSIKGLPNIQSLQGLENLANFTELVIENMANLETLEHLGANLPANYRTTVQNIAIHDNPKLTNVDGLRIVNNVTCKYNIFESTFSIEIPYIINMGLEQVSQI